MADHLAESQVDLTNCDREPIHIPGTILPHGAMIVADCQTMRIEQVAGDLAGLLGLQHAPVQGTALETILTGEQIEYLRTLLATSALQRPRHVLDPLFRVLPDRPLDASIHVADGALVIEFEDAAPADPHAVNPLACVQDMLDGLATAPDLQAYCQLAVDRVRNTTGYDRVMVYRFMGDGSGWVFAEAKRDELNPFLDLHYPASDIPKQARALYQASWLRLITEVDYTPAPLTPSINPRSGRPLDMSFATLRDVSPIHREYLRNMGVGASMSISIISEGSLWGLIACHHSSPRRLPRHLRAVCELFGSMFSLQLEARQRAEQLSQRLQSREELSHILHALAAEDDYGSGLVKQAEHLLNYLVADGLSLRVSQPKAGIAIRVNDDITTLGKTPSHDQIGALTDWLTSRMDDFGGVFVTDRLGELWPPAQEFADVAAGLLAVSISREPRDYILWFRQEAIEVVTWAGDPNKPVEAGPNGDRLTPRKSFEAWTETVRGRSAPWGSADNNAAFDLRVSLLEVVLRRIDAAARERLRAYEQEQLLMAELDHRVKNTLANIQALVAQTGRTAHSLIEFTEGLDRRIRSMARAHSLLTKSRWQGVPVRSLVEEELAAHAGPSENIEIAGEHIVLPPKAALSLSLALHELATNAAKYGALSVGAGRLSVRWTIDRDGSINLAWAESDGPPVRPPEQRGFGSTLIERVLGLETGGSARLSFDPTGVVCKIAIPASAVQHSSPSAETASEVWPKGAATKVVDLTGLRVLVVEDSALVLMLIESALADHDLEIVGPAMRLAEARTLAREEAIDVAILDINLDGEMSWDVAAILKERGIPFLFSTGYDGSTILPAHFAGEHIVSKPFMADDLIAGLRIVLAH